MVLIYIIVPMALLVEVGDKKFIVNGAPLLDVDSPINLRIIPSRMGKYRGW